MMLRIALLVVTLSIAGFFAWRRFKPDRSLAVSPRIKRLARSHKPLARALKMRASMVRMALGSEAPDAHPLASDVDAVIDALADMCVTQAEIRQQSRLHDPNSDRARQLRNEVADIDAAVRDALDQLNDLQVHLVKVTGAEIDAAVEDVRQRLAARKRDLAYVLEGHKEVEALLQEQDGGAGGADAAVNDDDHDDVPSS